VKRDLLLFDGHRFQAARLALGVVNVKGAGSPYECKESGFWRTFAETDLSDETAIRHFIARYGDPVGRLPAPSPVANWQELQETLKLAATVWGEPDSDGICHASLDAATLKSRAPGGGALTVPFTLELKGKATARRVRTLADFMQVSAFTMIANRTPMRRCDACGYWYGYEHGGKKYCRPACTDVALRQSKKGAA